MIKCEQNIMRTTCSIIMNIPKTLNQLYYFNQTEKNFTCHSVFNTKYYELKGWIFEMIMKITVITNNISILCSMNVYASKILYKSNHKQIDLRRNK